MEANVQRIQEKYSANVLHANHVTQLALRLYDDLLDLTELDNARDRSYLEHAASLHDIGHFVNRKKHHHHSYHLISSDCLLDEWPEKLRLWTAVLALNHRNKKLRLEALNAKHHDRAGSLIALLRMADALDYEHDQSVQIERIEIEWEAQQVHLHVQGLPTAEHTERLQGKFQLACHVWDMQFLLHSVEENRQPILLSSST
ncbi:HD domain-containing protein [Tumebacillus permanentifrigoris]|uniref:HD domain-containing protein n=1 Tax=Tumebacillus permanentifrigoris TaxID=378543 RepID=A0A316DC55_9BACL|nr:HD domain-containing protein [Tumebacillus permanentifrigoris]PWK14486.1 HD domain-containing protein [Tumebacillus permanentifrigoris]